MKITDKLAFEDAQIMARIAVGKLDSAFWFAAMQALKAAYKGEMIWPSGLNCGASAAEKGELLGRTLAGPTIITGLEN